MWASKQEASLAISGFGRDAREIVLTIEFTLPGPTAPNSKGEVSARVNGERVYSVFNAPNHRQTFSLRVARSLWNARETATISIYVDHLYNPKRDRGVADARDLGVGLIRLSIEAVLAQGEAPNEPNGEPQSKAETSLVDASDQRRERTSKKPRQKRGRR